MCQAWVSLWVRPPSEHPWLCTGKEFNSGPGKVKVGLLREVHFPSGVENGNPLQYSSLKTTMDREGWWATAHRIELDTTQRLSMHACAHSLDSMQWDA